MSSYNFPSRKLLRSFALDDPVESMLEADTRAFNAQRIRELTATAYAAGMQAKARGLELTGRVGIPTQKADGGDKTIDVFGGTQKMNGWQLTEIGDEHRDPWLESRRIYYVLEVANGTEDPVGTLIEAGTSNGRAYSRAISPEELAGFPQPNVEQICAQLGDLVRWFENTQQ